jgi:hypothetical protein
MTNAGRRIVLVVLLVIAVSGATTIWWRGQCHDDFCAGSRHRVTVVVDDPSGVACWNNIAFLHTGERSWFSEDHAPDEWPVGQVTGTLEVTSAPIRPFDTPIERTAVFTADQGGTVGFHGGTANSMSTLSCPVGPG